MHAFRPSNAWSRRSSSSPLTKLLACTVSRWRLTGKGATSELNVLVCVLAYSAGVVVSSAKAMRGGKLSARVFHFCKRGVLAAVSNVMRCVPAQQASSHRD